MKFRRPFLLLPFVALPFALIHCDDSTNNAGTPVQFLDASSEGSATTSPTSVGGGDSGPSTEDDAGDAGDAGDAAIQYDDAGCSTTTGPLPELSDAGFPTNGLALWLQADRGASVTVDGKLCRWDDLSGQGHTMTPDSPTSLATYDATGVKNRPAIAFAGRQNYTRGDLIGITPTSGRTMAAFGRVTDTVGRFHFLFQGQGGTPGNYFGLDQNTFQTSGSREGFYLTNNAYDTNVATTTSPRAHVLTVSTFASGSIIPDVTNYFVDGTKATLTKTPAGGDGHILDFSAANFTTVGAPDSTYSTGYLGEALIWNRGLTDLEVQQVFAHFSARYPNP